MSRVDDLRAEIFDLEDSLTCLTIDLENADDYVTEIRDQMHNVRNDDALRADIFEWGDLLTHLEVVDLVDAVAYVEEIEDKLYRVRSDIAFARGNLILIEGKKNV